MRLAKEDAARRRLRHEVDGAFHINRIREVRY
jgi:hypothetical protein